MGSINTRRSTTKGNPRSPSGAPARRIPDVFADRNAPPAQTGFRLSLPVFFLICGCVTGATLALLTLFDLTIGAPFYRASVLFDLGLLVGSLILLYLSYDARDGA